MAELEPRTDRLADAEAWEGVGVRLRSARDRLESSGSRQMWDIGDWIIAGERLFAHLKKREVRRRAVGLTGYSNHTLSMAASVARKIDSSMRIDGLSWWHHAVAAGLDSEVRGDWLTRAAEHGWSVRELRNRLREDGRITARRRDQERLVLELTRLRRAEIDEALIVKLREWWYNEVAGDEDSLPARSIAG